MAWGIHYIRDCIDNSGLGIAWYGVRYIRVRYRAGVRDVHNHRLRTTAIDVHDCQEHAVSARHVNDTYCTRLLAWSYSTLLAIIVH